MKYRSQAIVVFRKEHVCRNFFKKFETSQCDHFCDEYMPRFCRQTCLLPCCFKSQKRLYVSNKEENYSKPGYDYEEPLLFDNAPDPKDILWENLGKDMNETLKPRIMSYIGGILILCFSTVIVWCLNVFKKW